MTQLRILRKNFRWRIVPGTQIRFGGENPVEMVYDEVLQYGVDDGDTLGPKWYDVPIVEEGEKPLHTREVRRLHQQSLYRDFLAASLPVVMKQMNEAVAKAREEKK